VYIFFSQTNIYYFEKINPLNEKLTHVIEEPETLHLAFHLPHPTLGLPAMDRAI